MRPRELRAIVLILALGAGGCERAMRDMYDQPRPHPDAASTRFADGREARPPAAGSIARVRGVIAAASSGRVETEPTPLDARARLERGRERYAIYCAPCHSPVGDGDGMVVRRGYPRPPSFHTAALRALSDADIERVAQNGFGRMLGFGARIGTDDRRAIVAYIRALQLSQHATFDDLPPGERQHLERAP